MKLERELGNQILLETRVQSIGVDAFALRQNFNNEEHNLFAAFSFDLYSPMCH